MLIPDYFTLLTLKSGGYNMGTHTHWLRFLWHNDTEHTFISHCLIDSIGNQWVCKLFIRNADKANNSCIWTTELMRCAGRSSLNSMVAVFSNHMLGRKLTFH